MPKSIISSKKVILSSFIVSVDLPTKKRLLDIDRFLTKNHIMLNKHFHPSLKEKFIFLLSEIETRLRSSRAAANLSIYIPTK